MEDDVTTSEERAQWQRLADAATPGPLDVTAEIGVETWHEGPCWYVSGEGGAEPDLAFECEADARFYAAAREAVPALLADVERLNEALRKERDAARDEVDDLKRLLAQESGLSLKGEP